MLQCNGVYDIARSNDVAYQAVSDKLQIINETMMGNYTGACGGLWIDVTDKIRKQSHNFVDPFGYPVKVMLDGPGDDGDNIGVQLELQVPVMYYSTSEAK